MALGSIEVLFLLIALAIGLLVVVGLVVLLLRGRQPAPPPHANEGPRDAMWDSDGAVPRDPAGMPFRTPDQP